MQKPRWLLQVRLHHRDQRAVPDADERETHDPRRELRRSLREQWNREAQESIGAHLEQHGGEDHRARGGCFDVRVGEPGVEREHRHLDGEREREREEQPPLGRRRDRQRVECVERERWRAGGVLVQEVEPQDRDQHENAARHGVEEELDRRVHSPRAAPHADQEVHRNQHRFPEDVEQQQVGGEESAEHPALERQQQRVELARPLLDRAERGDHRDRREHHGQQHEQHRDAVDAERVRGAQGGQPGPLLHELPARSRRLEPPPQRERERHLGQGGHRGERADRARGFSRQHGHQDRAHEREEDHEREPRDGHHCLRKWRSSATAPSVRNSA